MIAPDIRNYTVGTETVITDTTISLSFNPSNNSDVETGDQVRITAVSSNSSDKIDTIKFYMYDDDKDEVDSRTSKSFNSTTAYYDLTIPKEVEDCDYITIKAIAKTMSGKTTEGTVKYYLDDDSKNYSYTATCTNIANVTITQDASSGNGYVVFYVEGANVNQDLNISVITTKAAYDLLENEGYVETIPSKGIYVSNKNIELMHKK